jgi:hypothetical protein
MFQQGNKPIRTLFFIPLCLYTLFVDNKSSAVLKGSMAGEPITAWQRCANDISTTIIGPQCRKKANVINPVLARKLAISLYVTTHVYCFTSRKAP